MHGWPKSSVCNTAAFHSTLLPFSWSREVIKNQRLSHLHLSDQRVRGWLLLDDYLPTFALTVMYLLIVWMGPKYMKHRQPFSCRGILMLYNLGLTLLSFYMFYEVNRLLSQDLQRAGFLILLPMDFWPLLHTPVKCVCHSPACLLLPAYTNIRIIHAHATLICSFSSPTNMGLYWAVLLWRCIDVWIDVLVHKYIHISIIISYSFPYSDKHSNSRAKLHRIYLFMHYFGKHYWLWLFCFISFIALIRSSASNSVMCVWEQHIWGSF